MAKLGTVIFEGISEEKYKFVAYSRSTNFKEMGAVYFVTKRYKKKDGKYTHKGIYVGETGNLSERHQKHHRKDCFDREKANRICVYVEEDEDERLKIEKDLREKYDPPCNRE